MSGGTGGMWRDYWPKLEAKIYARMGPRLGWSNFCADVRKRLDAGYLEYGDGSFAMEADAILAEMQEEALDVPGWGTILSSDLPAEMEDDLLLLCLQAHQIYVLCGQMRARLRGDLPQPPTCQYGDE